jgi:hypothetical protein
MTSRTFSFTVATAPQTGNPLYVNNVTGSDSRTKAQARSPSTPWRTLHRALKGSATAGAVNAAEAASAGDTVLVSPGIYWETGVTGTRFHVVLNPVNNGTAANPITIKGNGGRPDIRLNSGLRGCAVGSSFRDYIIWDSLTLNDTYNGAYSLLDPGVGYNVGDGAYTITNCTGCQIVNCDIYGHNGAYHWGYPTFTGNYGLVYLEKTFNAVVRNNHIQRNWGRGTTQYSGLQNDAGVMSYDAADSIIENNYITDCGVAVFIKGSHGGANPQQRAIIRKNRATECNNGFRIGDETDHQVYQNITVNIPRNVNTDGEGSVHTSYFCGNSRVFNNTCYGGGIFHASEQSTSNVSVRNNLVINKPVAVAYWNGDFRSQSVTYDRNWYYQLDPNYHAAIGVVATYAQWRTTYSRDTNSPATYTNPLVVNAAGGDFHLQSGSPALTAGRDYFGTFGGTSSTVIPVGAYVTGSEQIGADW